MKKAAVAVEVKVDAALKRAWLASRKAMLAAHREGAGAFDRKYEALAAILDHEPPLYLAGGYATARAFLEAEVGEDERSVQRNVRVARYASPAEEQRYGVSKLDAALAYLDAKTGQAVQGRLPVAFEKLRIPVDGQDTATVPLEKATVVDLRAATRALLRGKGASTGRRPARVVALAKVLQGAGLGTIAVSEKGGLLHFGGVAAEHLADFARALAKVKLPS